MKKTFENKRKIVIFSAIGAAVLLLIFLISFLIYRHLHPRKIVIAEAVKYVSFAEHIGRGEYYDSYFDPEAQAFCVYMFDEDVNGITFSEKVGINFFRSDDTFDSFIRMRKYVTASAEEFAEDEFPRYFMLGIDPYAAFLQSCSNKDMFRRNLEFIHDLSQEHLGTAFLIYFPPDSAEYWISLDYDQRMKARTAYITLVKYFQDCPNVMMYYDATREWVLYSECIRTGSFDKPIRGDIYDHLVSLNLTATDLTSMLTWNNVEDQMDRIMQMADEYADVRDTYADLTGKDVFFIGDSIIGNYRDTTSIPIFFRDMTGAGVYNLAVGGWAGIDAANPTTSMGCAVSYLLGKESKDRFTESFLYSYSYPAYNAAAEKLKDSTGKDAIFVIEFGLNDYFSGRSTEEYRDALIYFATSIKASYPDARILFLAPGYVHIFDDGMMDMGTDGTSSILQTYRDITYEVASGYGCEFMSLTDDFGFTQEDAPFYLLADNVHYNDNGRYRVAQGLARYFKK